MVWRRLGGVGVQDPLPVGPVLSQRDQAFDALKTLAEVLGPVVWAQVVGMVEELLPQKPASLSLPPHACGNDSPA